MLPMRRHASYTDRCCATPRFARGRAATACACAELHADAKTSIPQSCASARCWASPEKRKKRKCSLKNWAKKWKLRFPFRQIRKGIFTGKTVKLKIRFPCRANKKRKNSQKDSSKKWKLCFPFRQIRKEIFTGKNGKIENPFSMSSE